MNLRKTRAWVKSAAGPLALLGMPIVMAVTVIYSTWPEAYVPPPAPPSDITCTMVVDLYSSGWRPVISRPAVARHVSNGKAEFLVADTMDCVERHPDNPQFGERVNLYRMEWWRWKKTSRHRRITPSTH